MSLERKQPPLKKRKFNPEIEEKTSDTIKCVWCDEKNAVNPIDDDKNDNADCSCTEIASSLKSSICHQIIEIDNAGNSKSKLKCYKLLRSEQKNGLFQIDCKDGNVNFDSIVFQNKLSKSLETNGIIILRNLFCKKQILEAKYDILRKYLSQFIVIDKNDKNVMMKAQLNDSNLTPSLLNRAIEVVENTESVKNILENDKLFKITSILLESEHVITTKYKWLRCVSPSKFTGLHFDKMYMGSNTFNKMLSIWIPLADIPIKNGALIWCYGSQQCSQWKRYLDSINYGDPDTLDKDGTCSGWITDDLVDYFGENDKGKRGLSEHLLWATTEFEAGDVAIFGLNLIHQTLRNDTDCYRLSCDTRWTPLCQPLDKILKNCGISKGLR